MDKDTEHLNALLAENQDEESCNQSQQRCGICSTFNPGLVLGMLSGIISAIGKLCAKYLTLHLIAPHIILIRSIIQTPLYGLLLTMCKDSLRFQSSEKWYLLGRSITYCIYGLMTYLSLSRISYVELMLITYGVNSMTSLFISKVLIKEPISCLTIFSLLLVTGGICTACLPTVIHAQTKKTITCMSYIEGYIFAVLAGIFLAITGACNKYLKEVSPFSIGFYCNACNLIFGFILSMIAFSNFEDFNMSLISISYAVAYALLTLFSSSIYIMATRNGNIVDAALGMQVDIPTGIFVDHFWYYVPFTVYTIGGSIVALIGMIIPMVQLKTQR